MIQKKDITNIIEENITRYSSETFDRAFPFYKDGLKPVVRRIIYAMWEAKAYDFGKSATTVGITMGKYHPRGDTSIYDALVKMTEESYYVSHPYITAQGNFGSVTGDPPADMRYTECKLSEFCIDVITSEIDGYSVDFKSTDDFRNKEPVYLPSKLPLVLLQGSFGIGEAFRVSIPPHNIEDVSKMVISYINNKNISIEELTKGIFPDFPTGGIITNYKNLIPFYLKGDQTTIEIVSNTEIIRDNYAIRIVDLPFGVNYLKIKQAILNKIKSGNTIFSGISNIYEEPLKNNEYIMSCLIKCSKNVSNLPEMLHELIKETPMRSTFFIKPMVGLGKKVKDVTVKDIIKMWYYTRVDTKTRKYNYELANIRKHKHIYEGILLIYSHMDDIIKLIRNSKSKENAIRELTVKYTLSNIQAKGICEKQLISLSNFSKDALENNINECNKNILILNNLLKNIDNTIITEVNTLKEKYKKPRRTKINSNNTSISKKGIFLSQGIILYTKNSIAVFDSTIVNINILNGIKSANIKGAKKQEIIGYHNIGDIYGEELKGVIVFYDNETSQFIDSNKIYKNIWKLLPNEDYNIIAVIPFYDSKDECIILSDTNNLRKVKVNEFISSRIISVKNVKLIQLINDKIEAIMLVDNESGYLCIDADNISTVSKNSIGVNTYYSGKNKKIYLNSIFEPQDICILGFKNDEEVGFIYSIYKNNLNLSNKNNKPKRIINIPNLLVTGVGAINNESLSIGIIGVNNIKKCKTITIKKANVPIRSGIIPIGVLSLNS